MSSLPDDLWRRILEIGIETSGFTYKDLCCISISCRRLHRLSSEDPLWNRLLSSDFSTLTHPPSSSASSSSSKSFYKFRRALQRKESQIAEHSRRLLGFEIGVAEERTKARLTATELSRLRMVRQIYVAMNVCQPEAVSGRQEQMAEQRVVRADSRIHALVMKLGLYKQQIMELEKSHEYQERRLDTAKKELASMEYHPSWEHKPLSGGESEHNVKGKKMKSCNGCEALTLIPSLFQYLSKKSKLLVT